MRPRTEAAIAGGGLAVLLVIAGLIGRSAGEPLSRDPRASTFLRTPLGTRAFADALSKLGTSVIRFRQRPVTAPSYAGSDSSVATALVIISPTHDFSTNDVEAILAYSAGPPGGELVIAGASAAVLMRCFGYRTVSSIRDSTRVREPGRVEWSRAVWTRARLEAVSRSLDEKASARTGDAASIFGAPVCERREIARADTLLVDGRGRPYAIRLHQPPPQFAVTLVADGELFSNRALRNTDTGEWLLPLFQQRYDRILFDEFHHGFGPTGSLWRETVAWSFKSPLGWAVWQVVIVGLLALAAAAVRFGPLRTLNQRRRRAPLEHVRALATALAASHGHDVAIATLVRGLRRRLTATGAQSNESWRVWLSRLAERAANPDTRAAASRLRQLTVPNASAERVMDVANAVEDVWKTLRR